MQKKERGSPRFKKNILRGGQNLFSLYRANITCVLQNSYVYMT